MKILGAVSVVFSGFLLGLVWRREKQNELRSLRAVCEALTLLGAELETSRGPVFQIVSILSGETENPASAFLKELAGRECQLGEKSFAEIWKQAAEEALSELDRETIGAIFELGKLLGRFDLESQLNALRLCESKLRSLLLQKEESYRREEKLRLALPTMLGVFLTILLL